jgi:macrolide transport system ATP-binding/permease protein
MSLAQGWRLRLRSLFRRERVSQELDREIQFHLDQQVAENVANGMSPSEARAAASRVFGNTTAIKEHTRDTWGWTWLEQFLQDVRYALRQLRKTPGFTTIAVLSLALGIGANAAIFTLVHAVILRNLPVADPKMLIRIGDTNDCCVNSGAVGSGDYSLFSTETYERFKKYAPEFEQLAAMQAGFPFMPVVARRDGTQESARSVTAEFVSGNYFQTFGLRPAAGRLLSDSDDLKGAAMVAVMSHSAWKRDYAGAESVIGSTFRINTKAVTIVGIAPSGFFGDRLSTSPPDFYFPIETMTVIFNVPFVHDPDVDWLYIIGRVKPATELGPLQQKLTVFLKQWRKETNAFAVLPDKTLPEKTHVVLTPGGAGIQDLRAVRIKPAAVNGCFSTCSSHCLRKHRQPAAGSRYAAQDGDLRARCAGCGSNQGRTAAAHRKRGLDRHRWARRSCRGLFSSAHAFAFGILWGANHSH